MKKPKTFSFQPQQAIGSVGEKHFMRDYQELKPVQTDGRKFDILLADGTKIELKTDTYSMFDTPNLFMEHVSNTSTGKLGGPWRAKEDVVDFFVYLYLKEKTYLWYCPALLVERIEAMLERGQLRVKTVKNTTFETVGYTVPRTAVADLVTRQDTF